MRKLIILLMIVSLIFVNVPLGVFAAFSAANVGPTTDFAGDINIPTGKGYYINSTLLAVGDITNAAHLALSNLSSVAINTSLLSDAADTDSLGDATHEWLNLYIGDAGKIYIGLGQDISFERSAANTLTITASSGVIITAAGLTVGADIISDTADTDNLGSATKEWANLYLGDDAYVYFGLAQGVHIQKNAANEMTLTASSGVTTSANLTVTGTMGATTVTGEIRLITSDADPDTTGEVKHDSTATGFSGGVLRWYDNDSSRMIVDLETDASADDYVVAYDADADGFYMKADATGTDNWVLHLMDVDAADIDYVHAAIVGTGASQDITTNITNPDYGRNISVTSTAGSVGVVTITGTTADGTTSATDAITIVDGGTAVGVKAFVTVTNINVSDALISPEEVTIGVEDVIGLPNAISAEADIYMKTVDGVEEFGEISGNGNTTYSTLDCADIVQNEDITIYYHN